MTNLAHIAALSLLFAAASASAQATVHGGFAPPRTPSDRGVSATAAPDLWLATSEGFTTLSVLSISAQESLRGDAHMSVEVQTEDASITEEDLLEQLVTVGARQSASRFRIRSAFVFGVSGHSRPLPDGGEQRTFILELSPWTMALAQTSNYAVFEDVTPTDVLRAVFARYAFADVAFRVRGAERALERVVQYRESDLSFVLRVMSQADLRGHFEHRPHGHTFVITNAPPRRAGPMPVLEHGGSDPSTSVQTSSLGLRVSPTGYRLASRDRRDPSRSVVATGRGGRTSRFGALMMNDHLEPFVDRAAGERRASNHLAGVQRRGWLHAITPAVLELGDAFVMRGHPDPANDGRYRVVESMWTASNYQPTPGQPVAFECSVTAVPLSAPLVLPREPAPHADPQLATVLGPTEGQPNVDARGRVRVRFHWAPAPDGEMPTAWIPMMGGGPWRPNAGDVVLVHFIDGDPAQPVVWSR